MPLIINSPILTKSVPIVDVKPKRNGRGAHFDRHVEKIAPLIVKLRSSGVTDIRKLADRLNAFGIRTATNKLFSFGVMRRVLVRLEALQLGEGPCTKSEQASRARSSRPRSAGTRRGSMDLFIRRAK